MFSASVHPVDGARDVVFLGCPSVCVCACICTCLVVAAFLTGLLLTFSNCCNLSDNLQVLCLVCVNCDIYCVVSWRLPSVFDAVGWAAGRASSL